MLKVGLRFPLSSFHRELLQHLGLSVNQVSPNAWRVFIAVEVLYGVMSDGVRRLTVWEFLNYYRPNEIDKSRGMYSFIPRSPLLRLVYKTPNSNRNWKSNYFFLEGNEWMGRPGDTEFIPVNTTWGILHLSGMHPSVCMSTFNYSVYTFPNSFNRSLSVVWRRPQITLEEWSFLERIFNKTKPEERTWAKLVTLNTIYWYCDEPEPTPEAIRYDNRVCQCKSVTNTCLNFWISLPYS